MAIKKITLLVVCFLFFLSPILTNAEELQSTNTVPKDETLLGDQVPKQNSEVLPKVTALQLNTAFTSAGQVSVKLKNYLRSKTEISLAIKGKYLINNEVEITEGNDYTIKVENSTTLNLYANGIKVRTYQNSFDISPVNYGKLSKLCNYQW